MIFKNHRLFAIIFVLFVAFGIFAARQNLKTATEEEKFNESLRAYTEALAVIEEKFAGEINFSTLVDQSIERMLQTLDPHSSYASPDDYKRMMEDHAGHFFGIGINISIRNQRVTVMTPMENGPAYKLGIRAGDVIDKIDGISTLWMSLDEAVSHIRGPEGEPVRITIRRQGVSEPLEFVVIREKITEEAVPYSFMINNDTGYIKMIRFSSTAESEILEAFEKLRKQNMKKLILDLRDNPGGLLSQAINVSNIFIQNGTIVSIRGREKKDDIKFPAKKAAVAANIPLVVLINNWSASASEIVAGAIQDYDRGLLVGTTTFGKGLVQSTFPLRNGGAIFLTTAKYYTPSGRTIQRQYSGFYDYYVDSRLLGEQANLSQNEKYSTILGRSVYSGQGISPDIKVEDNFNVFIGNILLKSHFYNFASEYIARNPYISKNLTIDDKILAEFKDYLKKKNFEFTEKEFQDNKEDIQYYLAKDLFTQRWNDTEGVSHSITYDNQLQQAMKAFDQSEELLKKSSAKKGK
jgi:carboxyl-terminal processing protease